MIPQLHPEQCEETLGVAESCPLEMSADSSPVLPKPSLEPPALRRIGFADSNVDSNEPWQTEDTKAIVKCLTGKDGKKGFGKKVPPRTPGNKAFKLPQGRYEATRIEITRNKGDSDWGSDVFVTHNKGGADALQTLSHRIGRLLVFRDPTHNPANLVKEVDGPFDDAKWILHDGFDKVKMYRLNLEMFLDAEVKEERGRQPPHDTAIGYLLEDVGYHVKCDEQTQKVHYKVLGRMHFPSGCSVGVRRTPKTFDLLVHLQGPTDDNHGARAQVLESFLRHLNHAIRKRICRGYLEFRDGMSITKDAFVGILKSGTGKGIWWNELAASAIVRATTKLERAIPDILRELYELAKDTICDAKEEDQTPEAIRAIYPGADNVIRDVDKTINPDEISWEKLLRCLKEHLESGQIQDLPNPDVDSINRFFSELFRPPEKKNRTAYDKLNGLFLAALDEYFKSGVPELKYALPSERPNNEDGKRYVHVKVIKGDTLNMLEMLVYGTRCVSGHGSAFRTTSKKGCIGKLDNFEYGVDLTEADGSSQEDCEAVLAHLNEWLKKIKMRKERFAPDYATVLNCFNISDYFVRIIAKVACIAVCGPTSDEWKGESILSPKGRAVLMCRDIHTGQSKDTFWMWRPPKPEDAAVAASTPAKSIDTTFCAGDPE